MSNDKQHLSVRITGRVQGVGFRHFTRSKAQTLDVHGWVRNERDGSVRLEAEGDREALEHLLDAVHRGPSAARVKQVDADWKEATDQFDGFSVRF